MRMIPIKELKDTAGVSRMRHESSEPIHVTKNGYADMVIMSAEVFQAMDADARTGRAVALVQEGLDAVARGEGRGALEAVASLRGRYGL